MNYIFGIEKRIKINSEISDNLLISKIKNKLEDLDINKLDIKNNKIFFGNRFASRTYIFSDYTKPKKTFKFVSSGTINIEKNKNGRLLVIDISWFELLIPTIPFYLLFFITKNKILLILLFIIFTYGVIFMSTKHRESIRLILIKILELRKELDIEFEYQ